MSKHKPFRLSLAQTICSILPPLISQKVRDFIYPRDLAYRDDYRFEKRSITGSKFFHTTNDYHAYSFSVHGYYEWRHWAIAKVLCGPGGAIIEVGANVGTETIGFADLLRNKGRVFSFEPLPANFAALQYTLEKNHIENVSLFPYAVLDEKKPLKFKVPRSSNLSGSGHVIFRNVESAGEGLIEVEGIFLDDFLDKIHNVQLIFMDAEGSEPLIIQGAQKLIKRDSPVLVLEASQKQLSRGGHTITSLANKIRAMDYQIFHIGRYKAHELVPADENSKSNWLCLHQSQRNRIEKVNRFLLRCGLTPCFISIHPLVNV